MMRGDDCHPTTTIRWTISGLHGEEQMHIGVVFNPGAGARRGHELYRMTKAAVTGNGHSLSFLDVARDDRLENALADMICRVDVIAAIGGDGTLNGVVNGIVTSSRPDLPVAFFPAGRGRDTARAIPSFSLESLGKSRIDWGRIRKVDLGAAQLPEGGIRYFINVANVGLSAEAARVAGRLPRQVGSFSYVIGAVKGFLSTRPTSVTVCVDGQRFDLDEVLLLAICNGRSFGGGIYIAPDARADDGSLELVAVRNANLRDLALNLPKLRTGARVDHPALSSWPARSIEVTGDSLAPIDLDGEMWGNAPVSFSIVPSALNWIEPQS
jgi:diacylglycerol kinase (ATP)